MDPENPSSIVLPIAIMIAILAACGILSLVMIVLIGVITLAEFREANKEMRTDVRYEGIRYIISDYLEAQPAPDITERDLKAYAELERLYFYSSPDTVHAIVATDPKAVTLASHRTLPPCSPIGWWRPSMGRTLRDGTGFHSAHYSSRLCCANRVLAEVPLSPDRFIPRLL